MLVNSVTFYIPYNMIYCRKAFRQLHVSEQYSFCISILRSRIGCEDLVPGLQTNLTISFCSSIEMSEVEKQVDHWNGLTSVKFHKKEICLSLWTYEVYPDSSSVIWFYLGPSHKS